MVANSFSIIHTEGNQILPEVANSPRVSIHRIPVIENTKKRKFVFFAVQKVLLQHYYLLRLLWKLRGADFLLVQNPPSIPTLGVSRFFVMIISRKTKLIIDWHNLGYSILSLKLDKRPEKAVKKEGENEDDITDPLPEKQHLFVRLYKWYESFFGNHAYCHFTVSFRMGQVLRRRFKMSGRRILPIYDRPALDFKPLTFDEREAVIKAHSAEGDIFEGFGARGEEKVIITSTSYTPDEDIYILLKAAEEYDEYKSGLTQTNGSAGKLTKKIALPNLRIIITGKGPMLPEIKTYIAEKLDNLKHVKVYTAWLSTTDYPLVLGVADIGVSLHMSSSGVDLPMKAVDMFGCGVPVISLLYPALPELVKEGTNGLYIQDSSDLATALRRLFGGEDEKLYRTIKQGAIRESRIKWDHEWNKKVGPLFGIGEYRPRGDDEFTESSSSSSDDGF